MTVTQAPGPAILLAGRRYPLLLPRLRDPRLHVAAVIISVQVLGQTILDFDVSIAQILIAIGTAAVLELTIVAISSQVIAWPASALLTGNGVALILRTPGTTHGDWWSTNGWPIFMAAAGVALLSKYAIRVHDRPLFNPSNFGLVVVFLVFGARFADPQDLWWGPWRPGLALTFAIIVTGGITLSIRLKLFSVAATFWLSFAAAIAVLAVQGHAITARWHLGPVEGWSYWWVFVLSPEVVIFVFFMITDPKTAPLSRVARPIYAASVGLLAGVLAAMQRTEFATKVSLLLALTLVCAVRPLLERRFPDERVVTRRTWIGGGVAVVAALAAVAVAGHLNEGPATAALPAVVAGTDGARPEVTLRPDAVPRVALADEVADIGGAVSSAEAQRIGREVVADLAITATAVGALDADAAATAAFGPQLTAIEDQIATARADGTVAVEHHEVDSMEVVLLQDPVSPQAIPQLGVRTTGTVTELIYEGSSEGPVVNQRSYPVERLYLVTEVDGHYLIGEALDPASPMVVGG